MHIPFRKMILGASAVSMGLGITDLLMPRTEYHGLNRMTVAGLVAHTGEAKDYARDTIPGCLAFYGGAGVFGLLANSRRRERSGYAPEEE